MKHPILPLCLLFIALGLPNLLEAQIVIPSNRFTQLIDQPYREVLYETPVDITTQLQEIISAAGPDQTWDFSNLNYVDSTITLTHIFLVPQDDPFIDNPNLTGTTHIWQDVFPPHPDAIPQDTISNLRYGNFSSGRWTVRGSVSLADIDGDLEQDTFIQWFSPPSLQLVLPVNESSQWNDSTSLNQIFMDMAFTSSITLDTSRVTGWGTLITPAGTVEALRIYEKTVRSIPGLPTIEVDEQISFVSLDGNINASIVVEDGRAFYSVADFTPDNTTNTFNVRVESPGLTIKVISPNPAQHKIAIDFYTELSGDYHLSIYDIQGRVVAQSNQQFYPAGTNRISWERPAALSAGTYIAEIGSRTNRTRKLLILQ